MGRGEVLPDFRIRELIGEGVIVGGDKNLVNPSSLDLRVGLGQWKLLGSYYHIGNERLEAVLGSGRITDSEYAEGGDFYVDLNQPYMTRLMEGLDFSGLSNELSARIFNKSGRGRVGISVKGVTDPFYEFGTVPQGFSGNLYAEICATAFPVTIQPEQIAIPQIRFYNGDPTPLRGLDLGMLLREHPILTDDKG
ncbi:MAG: 2'-deoxycytidine 5'-triphosphate deaminase domain-containing protein, partial [Candidatus Nanoarchaeia archaeon]